MRLAEYLHLVDLVSVFGHLYRAGYHGRAVGLMYEPNLFGSQCALALALLVLLIDRVNRRYFAVACTLLTAGLVLSLTRAAMIGAVLGVALVLVGRSRQSGRGNPINRRRVMRLVGALIPMVVLVIALSAGSAVISRLQNATNLSSGTGQYRVDTWSEARSDLGLGPSLIIGLGTNSFGQRHENPYLEGTPAFLVEHLHHGGLRRRHRRHRAVRHWPLVGEHRPSSSVGERRRPCHGGRLRARHQPLLVRLRLDRARLESQPGHAVGPRTGTAQTSSPVGRRRILVVNGSGEVWGAERSLLILAEALPEHGFDVEIAAPPGGELERRAGERGIRFHEMPRPDHGDLSEQRAEASELSRLVAMTKQGWKVAVSAKRIAGMARDHDVLVSFSQRLHADCVVAGALARRPVVLDLHDVPGSSLGRSLAGAISRGAVGSVAISRFVATSLRLAPTRTRIITRPFDRDGLPVERDYVIPRRRRAARPRSGGAGQPVEGARRGGDRGAHRS